MPKGICEKCEWFEEIAVNSDGTGTVRGMCHRNPPIATGCFLPNVNRITGEMTPQLMETTIWPNVAAISWCGEWKAIENG